MKKVIHFILEMCPWLWWLNWNIPDLIIEDHLWYCYFHKYFSKDLIWSMTKPTKLHMWPGKTQISLHIRTVQSESSLCALRIAKNPRLLHMDSEDWSACVDAQADPNLRWAHRSFCWLVLHCLKCHIEHICRNRILPKRLNLRVEHVKHSNCRLDFLRRVKENDEKKKAAKEKGIKVNLKRQVLVLSLPKKWAASWQNQQSECAPSEDSDQPGHPPSLIRVFAVRMKKAWVLSYPLSAQRRLWSDWADAQADLSLCCAHTHFVGFVMSRLK